MAKKTKNSPKPLPDVSIETIIRSFDEAIAEVDLATRMRAEAGLAGPPGRLELVLASALLHMVDWTSAGQFKPANEEEVQCFLYHALVLQLGSTLALRAKPTLGKVLSGDMHFPDLILGDDPKSPETIYIEIKFSSPTRKLKFAHCMADIKKLGTNHEQHRQVFILWDCEPKQVFLSTSQKKKLLEEAALRHCTVWHHPDGLNNSPGKASAEKAIKAMKDKGLDFRSLGTANAAKAKITKAKKLALQLKT